VLTFIFTYPVKKYSNILIKKIFSQPPHPESQPNHRRNDLDSWYGGGV